MAIKERTVYPAFYAVYSEKELEPIFTPSKHELKWAMGCSRNNEVQYVLLVLLKCHQHLGYFPKWDKLPESVIQHFQQILSRKIHPKISSRSLERGRQEVRSYLNLFVYSNGGAELISILVKKLALTMADPADLVNASISELLRKRFSLPSYQVLERLVRSTRHGVHMKIFAQIENSLTESDRIVLDQLLIVKLNSKSPFGEIKEYPGPPKLSYIKEWMNRWQWLKDLIDTYPVLKKLAFTKMEEFAAQAAALELSDIKQIENQGQKYTLLLCLLHLKRMKTADQLTQMFIRRMRKTHQKAKLEWEQSQHAKQQLKQEMIDILAQVVQQAKLQKQNASFGEEVQRILKQKGGIEYLHECTQSLKSQSNNPLSFLWRIHLPYRKVLLNIIEALQINSATEDKQLIIAWQLYQKYRYSRKRYIIKESFPLGFASQRWKQLIVGSSENEVSYDRQLLELCLLSYICEALQSTDLYVENSLDFADYRIYMLPLSDSKKQEQLYCTKVELADNPEAFIMELKNELNDAIEYLDYNFKHFQNLSVDSNHNICLKRKKVPKPSSEVEDFKSLIRSKMPESNLLDILCRGNHWTNYTRNFFPVTTNETKAPNNLLHQFYTLFAYGCNLGARQTEKHTSQPVSRRIIQRLNFQHIDGYKLQGAIADVINHFNAFELVHNWGESTTAIADGTHIELSENNLMGERHIRYGGYGGIAYHHISDTYIALFSHFIACGTWEAVYILDGVTQS